MARKKSPALSEVELPPAPILVKEEPEPESPPEPARGHDIVVIGASAGGVRALRELVAGFPVDLPAAVFVVLHISPDVPSFMPEILTSCGPLPSRHGRNGDRIEPGRIYVAPPDMHMLVERGHISVVHGPKENRHRPAIDPLFRSAALAYGSRVVGVALSGVLDDGSAGLAAIHSRGGVTIVQDPSGAAFSGMPGNALRSNAVDHC
jgi:two-component system chemotaxis response regulator CheB